MIAWNMARSAQSGKEKRKFINKGKSKNNTAKNSQSKSNKIQPQKLKRGDDQMDQVIKDKISTGVWAAIGGAILTMIIGFNWGGWVTGGTAQSMA